MVLFLLVSTVTQWLRPSCLWPQMQEEKQMERRKKIAVELSELVVYCRPVPFDEDSE